MKYPYMQFFTADWVSDPALSMCSATTRGIWIDLLCAMHSNGEGELTGTPEMLSRIARCTVAEMLKLLRLAYIRIWPYRIADELPNQDESRAGWRE